MFQLQYLMSYITCSLADSDNATNESIQMTEIYEYGISLAKPTYSLPTFQKFKFFYATKLVDAGMAEEVSFFVKTLFEIKFLVNLDKPF